MRICGEDLYAKHTIYYDDLPNYFLGFSIWEDRSCLSWPDTLYYFAQLGITPVPILYEGLWDEESIRSLPLDLECQEGYVVRIIDGFDADQFEMSLAKFVRRGHVDENASHWMHESITPNRLATKGSK